MHFLFLHLSPILLTFSWTEARKQLNQFITKVTTSQSKLGVPAVSCSAAVIWLISGLGPVGGLRELIASQEHPCYVGTTLL